MSIYGLGSHKCTYSHSTETERNQTNSDKQNIYDNSKPYFELTSSIVSLTKYLYYDLAASAMGNVIFWGIYLYSQKNALN